MSKELEALQYFLDKQDKVEKYGSCEVNFKAERENLAVLKKSLKVLEIIKKSIYVEDFYYDDETDKYFFLGKEVNQEEYYLLKEILK